MAIRELDKKLIFSLQNYNDPFIEGYAEIDPTIVGVDDSLKIFGFEGYQIYQFADGSVTTSDIGNPDKVRLLFQCDKVNGVDQIVNFNHSVKTKLSHILLVLSGFSQSKLIH